VQGDRFPALWDESQRLRLVYEKTDAANMAEVERLLRTKRCQITRVNGLIDRTLGAMHEYFNAAKKYYEVWGDAEVKRVEIQQKSLANMETEKASLAGLLDDGKKDREALEQREAALEQSTRTEEIRRQIDDLKQQILESDDRLKKTQEKFDSLSFQIAKMKAELTKRLVDIRRYSSQLEEDSVEEAAIYEDRRKAAHEVCDTKQPGTLRTAPKRTANP
jgi:chromosome segregation ATPase